MTSNSLSPARQALSHPDFARYAYGRFAATLAWQMIDVVLGYQVWQLTHNEAYLGFIGLAQFLPFVVLLLPGGQIADRFDRRLIIALAYGLELMAAAALLTFTLTGQSEVVLLFFIAALLGVGRSFWAPAGQAMVPNLVPKELLSGAISFNTLLFTIATIAGPAVAGLTLILGIDWSYGITVALLIAAMFLIVGLKPVRAKSSTEWHWSDFLDGFVFVWKKKPVLGAISLDLFAVLFGGVVALLPAYADEILHVDTIGLGLMRAAPGVGAAIVAFWLGVRPITRHAGTWMFGGVALFGLCMITVGLSTTPVAFDRRTRHRRRGRHGQCVRARHAGAARDTGCDSRPRERRQFDVHRRIQRTRRSSAPACRPLWIGIVPTMIWGGVCTLAVVGSYLGLFPQLRKLDKFPEPVH